MPFLAVETVRTEIYEEEIDFKVEQVVDASQYKGYNQIQNYGSKGEKRIVAQVTYLDGVETDREILSTQVLKEPVNETVLVGSKVPENQMKPSVGSTGSVGSGTFIWPVGGQRRLCKLRLKRLLGPHRAGHCRHFGRNTHLCFGFGHRCGCHPPLGLWQLCGD